MPYLIIKNLSEKDIDVQEHTIAKWGILELKVQIYFKTGGFKYKLYLDGEQQFETNYLDEAMKKYNEYTGE
jgi:hypothetical protein